MEGLNLMDAWRGEKSDKYQWFLLTMEFNTNAIFFQYLHLYYCLIQIDLFESFRSFGSFSTFQEGLPAGLSSIGHNTACMHLPPIPSTVRAA
jgi:hypothetical protein